MKITINWKKGYFQPWLQVCPVLAVWTSRKGELPPSVGTVGAGAYRLVSSVYSDQEEKLRYKEADAEVLVDGVPVTLEPTEKAKREDANQETDKRQQNSNPCDHIQKEVMDSVTVLWTQKDSKLYLCIAK